MIPNGSTFKYVGTWRAGLSRADVLTQNVVAALAVDGLVSRAAPKVNASLITTFGGSFGVTLQLQVANGLGYGTIDDVISVIRHEVLDETGYYPSSDDVAGFTTPSGDTQSTGQPDNVDTSGDTAQCIAGSSTDTDGNFSISCWFKNLTTQGLSTVGLLAIVAIAGIGLVLWASGKVEH